MQNRWIIGSVIAGVLALSALPAWALEIYSYVDSRGVRHLADRRKHTGYRLIRRFPRVVYRSSSGVVLSNSTARPDRSSFQPIIQEASRRTGLHSALIQAVIRTESAFDPDAVSSKGAVGLMQLMPATAQQYGVSDLTDPKANVYAGSLHLRELMERFSNDLKLSLAAYNAGEGAVRRYGNTIPPYPETQQYVVKVLRYYREYLHAM